MDKNKHDNDATVVERILESLDWQGLQGQMAQIDINMLLDTPAASAGNDDDRKKPSLRQDLLNYYIGERGVGSVLNNMNSDQVPMWKISDFRKAAIQIQETAKKYQRPPVIWGMDSVHGANYLYNTIVTPQPLNLAASFNLTLAHQAGQWASRDTRRAGISWLFSPLLGLSWNPLWSRTYETFGEDPLLVGYMARAMIRGIQDPSTKDVVDDVDDTSSLLLPSRAAACAKHWVGYSFPHNGHDRAPSWILTRHLYQYFLPPWAKVLDEVDTVMESYTEVDGVPNVANRRTLVQILRHQMGFRGMLVTDYHEIFNLVEWHHTAANHTQAMQQTLEEGSVDMSMIANEPDLFFAAFQALDEDRYGDRVRESARRVLQVKQKIGLLDEGFRMKLTGDEDRSPSPQQLQAALEMTQQSIVLTENKERTLPLDPNQSLNILVTGPTSNSKSFQSGGWIWQWQGVNSNREDEWFTYGETLLKALQREQNWQVAFECGVDILGRDCQTTSSDAMGAEEQPHHDGVLDTIEGWVGWEVEGEAVSIDRAVNAAKGKDVIVVCLGEENYSEKPGDIRNLELPVGQYELVVSLREAAPSAKLVLVYFGGRPRLVEEVVPSVDAVLLGFLSGPHAGTAVANILNGATNPNARLPVTYPKFPDGGGTPYLHAVSDMCTSDTGGTLPHWENSPCDVQWPFGHGLSYTTFDYQDFVVGNLNPYYASGVDGPERTVKVQVTVKNTGAIGGAETVLLFSFDESRSTTPEYKRLRAFEKIWLEPGASRQMEFDIPLDDLRFVGPHDDTHYILEEGLTFRIGIGAYTDCRVSPDDVLCSDPIKVHLDQNYVGACEAACTLWSQSGCEKAHDMSFGSCSNMCSSIHKNRPGTMEMNNDGWGWNYVDCLQDIVWEDSFSHRTDCWKLTSLCRNIFETPLMDDHGAGVIPDRYGSANDPIVLTVAVASGVLASILVFYSMRGGFSKKQDEPFGNVQFSEVRTHEIL